MEGYDTQLDRWDVAIRGIINLYRNGKWPILKEFGLNRKDHAGLLDEALLEIGFPSAKRGEMTLFKFLHACPFLVDAAIPLMFPYWKQNALSREWTYRQRPRGRGRA